MIKDACLMIDLLKGSILDLWLQLKIETWLTDWVLRGLHPAQAEELTAYIDSSRINLRIITEDEYVKIHALRSRSFARGLSPEDLSSIHVAQEGGMMLLAGNGILKKHAADLSIDVQGTLWVFEKLVSSKLLPPGAAALKLTKLLECGRRLPEEECEQLLCKWRPKK